MQDPFLLLYKEIEHNHRRSYIQLRRQVMVKVLNKLDDLNGNKESSIRKETPGELFGKLIGQSIAEIQDGYKK